MTETGSGGRRQRRAYRIRPHARSTAPAISIKSPTPPTIRPFAPECVRIWPLWGHTRAACQMRPVHPGMRVGGSWVLPICPGLLTLWAVFSPSAHLLPHLLSFARDALCSSPGSCHTPRRRPRGRELEAPMNIPDAQMRHRPSPTPRPRTISTVE